MEIPSLPRIIRWFALLGAYFWVLSTCASISLVPFSLALMSSSSYNYNNNYDNSLTSIVSTLLGFLTCLSPIILIGGLMAFFSWVFNRDKKREQAASDDFRNDNFLYRYGYRINELTLPIPIKTEWTDQEIEEFVTAMRQKIASQIQNRFSSAGVQVTSRVRIKDKDLPSDNRIFLKVIFRSRRGSQVSHFITYAIAGKYVVIHYISQIRGTYRWHDVVNFVVNGPWSIWFWGVRWFQNEYSIVAAISRMVNNSYDLMDLKTYFEASFLVLLDETKNFLKEKGLLTEELNQIIVNNINNSQNVNVSGSQGISFGSVANVVQGVVQSVGKQI